MDDDKVRELLDRYRPVGARGGLRERALAGAVNAPRTWPWAAAAAALLAVTLGLHVATNRAIARVAAPADANSVEELAAAMGGGEEAERAARLVAAERAFRIRLTGGDADNRTEDELNGVN